MSQQRRSQPTTHKRTAPRALAVAAGIVATWFCCSPTSAWSEANDYISLIAGKTASVRVCPAPTAGEPACSNILKALTSASPPAPLTPVQTIPRVGDDHLKDYGASCPAAGADIRGDPYEPYETEFDGERATPFGPFEIFDLSGIYPDWKGHSIIKAQGYGPKNFGTPTPAFGWAGFYVVQNSTPCPLISLSASYSGGFDQPTSIRYASDLVQMDGNVLLIHVVEVDAGASIYHGTVYLIESKPSMQTAPNNANRKLIMTFTAK